MCHFWSVEHSENRNITYFENEVGPGVLQFNIQQIYNLQICTQRGQNRHAHSQLHIILPAPVFVERWT